MPIILIKRPSFKYFPVMLPELRAMVVDEMEPGDRCRFSGASKRSNKEAKSSKNYIGGIEFEIKDKNRIRVGITYGKRETNGCDFLLEFTKIEGNNFIRCLLDSLCWTESDWRSKSDRELWTDQLSCSTNLVEFAARYFKRLLKDYQNVIKELRIIKNYRNEEDFDFDMGITSLNNLESLYIDGRFNCYQFLSKTKRPLKRLYVHGDVDYNFPMDKIYKVQENLDTDIEFNNDMFLQLTAKTVWLEVGQLSPEDIYHFIRLWQKGEIRREMQTITLSLERRFDVRILFRLLKVDSFARLTSGYYKLELPHFKELGRKADLFYIPGELKLEFDN